MLDKRTIAERNLWAEIMLRTWYDCCNGNKGAFLFFQDSKDFLKLCELLNFSSTIVRQLRIEAVFAFKKRRYTKYSILDIAYDR